MAQWVRLLRQNTVGLPQWAVEPSYSLLVLTCPVFPLQLVQVWTWRLVKKAFLLSLTSPIPVLGVARQMAMLVALVLWALLLRKDLEKEEGNTVVLELRVWVMYSMLLESVLPVLWHLLVKLLRWDSRPHSLYDHWMQHVWLVVSAIVALLVLAVLCKR